MRSVWTHYISDEIYFRNDSSCNDFDSNLIDQKWVEKAGNLSIGMYAFRFDSSDEVIITCTAFVCSSSDKSSNCTRVRMN